MIVTPSIRAHLRTGVCVFAACSAFASPTVGIAQDATPEAVDTAQPAPPPNSEPRSNQRGIGAGEIVVSGRRLNGQLDVEQEPLLELAAEDIAAEGVASIAELVTQITNQTGSARGRGGGGRPVILVNGIRVGSFREVFQYPPESLEKVEVFSEEIAQRFGFGADRRVINLILKESYSSLELEGEFEGPSRGGYLVNEQELGYLKITGGGRINANFTARDVSLLTESERDIVQTPGSQSDFASDPDQAEFRSLISDTRSLNGSLSFAKAFKSSGLSVSANAEYTRRDNLSLSGLNAVTLIDPSGAGVVRTFGEDTPLERRTATDLFEFAGSVSKPIRNLQLVSTFDASRTESETAINRRFDTSQLQADAAAGLIALDTSLPTNAAAGVDLANSQTTFAFSNNTLRGPIAYLPGGELTATFYARASWRGLKSDDTRTNLSADLDRRALSTGANLVVPITSRRNGFADALGSFTLNLQAGVDDVSDFGVLGDYSAGLTWPPFDNLDLSATYIYREVAPGLGSLGSPEVTTFNVPFFDFTLGETALVTVISGGNPDLLAETQTDWKFAANWNLPFWENTRFSVEYIRNRSSDVTSSFPTIRPDIESAFPDRVFRDPNGRLSSIDVREVTFAETRADRLQINLFTRGRFGQPRQSEGARGRPDGGRPGGRPASGGSDAATQSSNAEPGADRRQQFMQLRERICADDGLEFLNRLVSAVENGQDLSGELPGYDRERAERLLSRIRDENGEITSEGLAGFRERICSMDPAMMARGGQRGAAQDGESSDGGSAGETPRRGPGGPMAAAFAALRERICGEDGSEQLAKIVAAIEAGEDVSEVLSGVDPTMLSRMLDRARDENGEVSPEALERFRTRICESSGAQAGDGQSGGPQVMDPRAFFGGGRRGGWSYFLSFNNVIELKNEILIAPGVPVLDQLNGDSTGFFGQPRYNARLEAGLFRQGIGMRLSGQYNGSTRIDGSGLPGSTDLFIGDLLKFDLRVFSNIGELIGKNDSALKNLRVSLRMDNVFDTRREVTDSNGDTPINYQPFLIDPTGRYIGIDIRKLF